MLTHTIERYKPITTLQRWHKSLGKPRLVVGSEEHKNHIYIRLIEEMSNTNQFDAFNSYSIKGRNCTIINWADFEKVEWDGMKCCLIEVMYDDDGEFDLVHPSDLKKPRKE